MADRLVRPGAQSALLRHEQSVAVGRVDPRAGQRQLRQRHQPLLVVHARHQSRHRQARVALPEHAPRRVGLRRRERAGPRRRQRQRPDDPGDVQGRPQRLLLRPEPEDRPAHLRQVVRPHQLGDGRGHGHGAPHRGGRQAPALQVPGDGHLPQPPRRQELAADELQPADRARLHPVHQPVHGHGGRRARLQARHLLPRVRVRPRQERPRRVHERAHGVGSRQAAEGVGQQGRAPLARGHDDDGGRARLPRRRARLVQGARRQDGEALWQFNTGSGISAAPVTYELDGKQYVAVVSGRTFSIPVFLGPIGKQMVDASPEGGTLFVFELPSP